MTGTDRIAKNRQESLKVPQDLPKSPLNRRIGRNRARFDTESVARYHASLVGADSGRFRRGARPNAEPGDRIREDVEWEGRPPDRTRLERGSGHRVFRCGSGVPPLRGSRYPFESDTPSPEGTPVLGSDPESAAEPRYEQAPEEVTESSHPKDEAFVPFGYRLFETSPDRTRRPATIPSTPTTRTGPGTRSCSTCSATWRPGPAARSNRLLLDPEVLPGSTIVVSRGKESEGSTGTI